MRIVLARARPQVRNYWSIVASYVEYGALEDWWVHQALATYCCQSHVSRSYALYSGCLQTICSRSRSWWSHVEQGPPDAIFGLVEAFKKDPRPDKISLAIGAYRDANNKPFVLPTVKKVCTCNNVLCLLYCPVHIHCNNICACAYITRYRSLMSVSSQVFDTHL